MTQNFDLNFFFFYFFYDLNVVNSSSPSLLWTLLLVLIIPQKIMTSCSFTATSLFINNSSPAHMAGSVNGIAMTATAIAR